MENRTLESMHYWVEPAHPMVIKLYEDLVTIYRFIKDNYQKEIDAAFDRASQQIGFVVTTTVPVMLEIGEGGVIKSLIMGSECLKGTALEKELLMVFDLNKKTDSKVNVSSGVYNLALFWYEAVNLRLRTDWMEPAHPVYQLQSELMGLQRSPQSARAMSFVAQPQPWMEPAHPHTPWMEPAHHGPWCRPWMEPAHPHTPWMEPAHHGPWCRPWMEPAHPVFQASELQKAGERMYEHTEPVQYLARVNQIILEKTVLVSAIDMVYPELKLGERLEKAQYAMSPTLPLPPPRAVWPGVREPAHMMGAASWATGPTPHPWKHAMMEIAQILEKYQPVPVPWKGEFLHEVASVLHGYSHGMLNPQPLPPAAAAWPGVREPAHMMGAASWARGPNPQPWWQIMAEIAQMLERYGPQPDPWKYQLLSEIESVLGKYSYGMLNPQPLPPAAAAWPGVREPAHMMTAMQPGMQQMLSEMAAVMRKYGMQI